MTPLLSATLLRTQADPRLVALTRQGHERAFEAIVERYRRPLHRHVRRLLPESRAEDAVQQTFLKAWSSLQDGADVRELRPWLYRIAHNAALDALKRAGYDYDELTESVRSTVGPEADVERRTVMRETLAGLAALPSNQREALLRTVVAGDSRAQIAHDLGISDGAVRQLVHRARSTLRAAATAVTPTPVAVWAAGAADAGAPSAARLAEIGAAGGAGALLKAGAVIVGAGVLVTGPVAISDLSTRHHGDADAAATRGHPPPAVRWVANGGIGGSGARSGAAGDAKTDGAASSGGGGGSSSGSGGSHSGSSRHPGSGSGSEGAQTGGEDHHGASGSGSSESGSSSDGRHSTSGSSGSGSGGDDHSGTSGSGSGGGTSGEVSGSGDGISGGGSGSSGEGSGSGSSGDGMLGNLMRMSGPDGGSTTTTETP